MILIENAQIMGLEPTIRGMRNPMNSWAKSDSGPCLTHGPEHCKDCPYPEGTCSADEADLSNYIIIGPNDLDLMLRLAKAGSVDGKFRRMIAVYVDLTAPLYWWKEFDTYKVGTVANSCSTMHKIHSKPFTMDDFSCEHLLGGDCVPDHDYQSPYDVLSLTIDALNFWRGIFVGEIEEWPSLGKGDKRAWWQMIQLLPSSYNQKRTVMLNYEVLANIYQHRRNHKLDEWRKVCQWIETLPYSEVITCNANTRISDGDAIISVDSVIAMMKAQKWSDEEIRKLINYIKKEQLKTFVENGDTRPVHGGIFDMPDLTAGNVPKES